jgi:uncharacterized protein YdeI (YjbR/CyaY-like superfamily)
MGTYSEKTDQYIGQAAEFAKPILTHIRSVVHAACPEIEEAWKWSFPNFLYKGNILCSMAAFKQHCSFGFWKAGLMSDPHKIMSVSEKNGMGDMGKLTRVEDLPPSDILIAYIREAMLLNDTNVKRTPKAKPTEAEKKSLAIPDDLTAALAHDGTAAKHFEAFPYSHKKEYVLWITDAKTEATRAKRIAQAVEWIAEGKDRNWKYKNC